MKTIILDTNPILRYLLGDIRAQALLTKQLFQDAKKGEFKIVVLQIVLFEAYFVLNTQYDLQKDDILTKLESLVKTKFIKIEDREVFLQAIIILRNTNLSFVDSFLVAKAQIENVEIFTFDKELKRKIK